MAEIHNNTTMSPTKLELLSRWLPEQPWFTGSSTPKLAKVGGFRLDDPAGEVGIEFMFVTDESSSAALARPTTYHVPMAYRGAPLPGAEHALVGTSRHGVLGKRWISRPRPSVAPPSGFSSTGSPVSPSRKYRALQLT